MHAWASEEGEGGPWTPGFWKYQQKRLFSWFREGKNKFYHFWLPLEKFWKNPLVASPGNNLPKPMHAWMLNNGSKTRLEIYRRQFFEAWTRRRLMLPLLEPHFTVDVCNELATNFTIQDDIKILSKLSVSESDSIVFSGVWKVLGLLLFYLRQMPHQRGLFSAPKCLKT